MNNEQANIDRFNVIARDWDADPERVRMAEAIAASMLDALALDGSGDALEFGAGTGLITLRLAPHLEHVTAMDSSPEMLAVLRRKCEQQGRGNVTLLQGSVPGQLPDEHFDLIFSSMTLHHVEDVEALFHELHGRLRPGGRVAFADLDTENGPFHKDSPGIAHHGFQRDAFAQWLRVAGFGAVRFSTAYRTRREDADGKLREYPIFLAVAEKPGS
ncbi:MAG: class I SAM-dependent methyltransferase [Rhodanobacteraceae bacterium]